MPQRAYTCALIRLCILFKRLFLHWVVFLSFLLIKRLSLFYDALDENLCEGLLRSNSFEEFKMSEFDIPVEVESSHYCNALLFTD